MSNAVLITSWVVAILTLGFSGFLIYEFVLDFDTTDEYTYSNFGRVTTDHYDLRLELDFDEKVIVGEQKLQMRALGSLLNEVVLDIQDLTVNEVLYNDTPVSFKITNTMPELGQALRVKVPLLFSGTKFEITVKYKTSPEASALSWLEPSQTQGNNMAYLFSQCETIHCRSIAPFQDTPQVKSTFNVHILSPKNMIVRATGNMTEEFDYDNHRSTRFESTIPVPSYLFSIVAGDLSEEKIGDNIYLITESEMMRDVRDRLPILSSALTTLESYLTPYVWGDYKIVVQPPSFPHSGMENPLLSFTSYTVVQGDDSAVNDVIHELAHSWAGNMVTHEKWVDVWLKEALATFLERKVIKTLQGESAYKNSAQRGKVALIEKIAEIGPESVLSSLEPDPAIVKNPDLILSPVQTEKGFQLLALMEQQVGETIFKDFLIQYINKFAFQTVDAHTFKDDFLNYIYTVFDSKTAREIYAHIDLDTWISQPGMPPVDMDFATQEYTDAIAMAEEYIINDGSTSPSNYRDFEGWSADVKYMFLEYFMQNTSRLTYNIVNRIRRNHDLTYLSNPDLISQFMQIAVAGEYYESPFRYPREFVGVIGRYELIAPVYFQMNEKDQFAAQETYNTYESFYAPSIRDELRSIVGL